MKILDYLLISNNINLLKSPKPEAQLEININYKFETYKNVENETPVMVSLNISITNEKEEILNGMIKYLLSISDIIDDNNILEQFIIDSLKIEFNSNINSFLVKAKIPPLPIEAMVNHS